MRTYFDCGLIDVGVIVTRAEELNEIFKQEKDENGQLLIKKYGASTTWMGKLIYRLDSRRNGGCPILAVGIRKECIEGYGRLNKYYNKLFLLLRHAVRGQGWNYLTEVCVKDGICGEIRRQLIMNLIGIHMRTIL